MQTSELKITKKPIKEELVLKGRSESTAKVALNAQATDVFLQKISIERPYVSENLQRNLNSLHASLSEELKNPTPNSNKQHNAKANAPLARLSTKLIERDPNLQEKTARALSTPSQPVSSRQAADTLNKSLAQLPASLQEGSETGDALARTLTGSLSDLSDHSSMGAGLIRDLAVRGIYVTDESLPLKNRVAAERVLSNTVTYIKANSPQVLSTLTPSKLQELKGSTAPSLRAEHNKAEHNKEASSENLRNNTYLDIFKKKDASASKKTDASNAPEITSKANTQAVNATKAESITDESIDADNTQNSSLKNSFAEPSERIRQIIEKAADTVRRGNLMRSDSPATPQETTVSDNNKHSPLRDLVSRASMLERQFREERQRISADSNSNVQEQKQNTVVAKDQNTQNAENLRNNSNATTLNTLKDLNKAQLSFSYSALQNSFYGGIASVPGMDLPVEDFNSTEVKNFIANSQAAELSSKKLLNTVLREQRELLQSNENGAVSEQNPVNSIGEKTSTAGLNNATTADTKTSSAQDKIPSSNTGKNQNSASATHDVTDDAPTAKEKTEQNTVKSSEKTSETAPQDTQDKIVEHFDGQADEHGGQHNKVTPEATQKNAQDDAVVEENVDPAPQELKDRDLKEQATAPLTLSQDDAVSQDANRTSATVPSANSNLDNENTASFTQNNVSTSSAQNLSLTEDNALQEQTLEQNNAVLSKQALESVLVDEKTQQNIANENIDDESLADKNISTINQNVKVPNSEGILNFLTPTKGKEQDLTSPSHEEQKVLQDSDLKKSIQDQNANNAQAQQDVATLTPTTNEDQVLPSAASIVTSGGNEPIPERTMPEFSAVTKDDGLFKRIASLFSRPQENNNTTNEISAQMVDEVAVKVPLLKNTPFDVFMQSLSVASSNLKLPESVRKEALKLKAQLASPLSDLKAVDSWLSFVTGPMSLSSTQAIALQQWAFLILCLRFKQLGKNISSFLKKNELKEVDRELEDSLLPFPDCKDDIAELSTQALDQIASAQQKRSESASLLFDRYIPLPPSYEGGHEGGMSLKKSRDEKGKNVWHMTFQFDLEKLGAVEIKAVACLPEVRLSFAAETLEGLKSMQNNCGHLAKSLEKLGLEAKTSAPRLGRIRPLCGARESKPLDPSPATGISLEI